MLSASKFQRFHIGILILNVLGAHSVIWNIVNDQHPNLELPILDAPLNVLKTLQIKVFGCRILRKDLF
jgi:hypothetical protein